MCVCVFYNTVQPYFVADAGDSVEDANFDISSAEAGILKLYTMIEWVKEMLSSKHIMRCTKEDTFHDKVFASEMNLKLDETARNYEKMLFREALRTGFFEMQAARDKVYTLFGPIRVGSLPILETQALPCKLGKIHYFVFAFQYRELCGAEGMKLDLVERFIKWQAIALSPICPHVAEHIWDLLSTLERKSSILHERWPTTGNVDEICIKSSVYLMDVASDFRKKLKAAVAPPKPKKGQQVAGMPKKPTHATIYVAKTYPPWQCAVLSTMKKMYESSGPDQEPDNKAISQELDKNADLKQWKKKVMPFVAFTKERIAQIGMSALGK